MGFRVAKSADAKAVLDIYAPYCLAPTAVTFEVMPPTVEEMQKRIVVTTKSYPWLIYEEAGTVMGYAYADQHRTRDAYRWDVDVSIYLHEKARGKGVGKKLYQNLFDGLRTLGFFNAYAGIGLPNEASIALHKSLGFSLIGVYNNVGYKAGAWRDVAWFGLKLQPYTLNPPDPIKFSQLGI
jgi:L-amino acid N-acyltransferase YncA